MTDFSSSLYSSGDTPHHYPRYFHWDYLRAFMVLLVVIEHALLPYSPLFKNTAFIGDFEGHVLFDVLHLHNDLIMMPMLFLIAGLFIIPSYNRRGLQGFVREKGWRWGVPFILGVIFLVPLQTYLRDLIKLDDQLTFVTYLREVYFFDKIQSSGFWFLYFLALLTTGILILNFIFPTLIDRLSSICNHMLKKPWQGFIYLILLCAVILGISDLFFGPFWWQGFGKLFYVRGARFGVKIIFFLIGIGLSQLSTQDINNQFKKAFKVSLITAVISFSIYAIYCIQNFYTGAYGLEITRYLKAGGSLAQAGPYIIAYAPPILIRTTLHACALCSLSLFYICLFITFLNHSLSWWRSLAACSFGIYIFHEPIQVGMTYLLYDQNYSEFLKFPLVVTVTLTGSWLITHYLKDKPGFRKVL